MSDGSTFIGYTYSPLGQDEIRLIKLHSNAGTEALHCDLIHHKLTDNLKYDTISYAWGDAVFDRSLIITPNTYTCNEHRERIPSAEGDQGKGYLYITSTLYSALQRAQKHRPNQCISIWADAICINQEDVDEKNSQVQLMRRIYESAETTWIDLGEECNGSAMILDIVAHVLDNWEHISSYPAGLDITLLRWTSAESAEWQALNAFISRPWFSRVWIVQEAALAKNPIMLCGNWSMPLDDFTKCMSIMLLPLAISEVQIDEMDTGARRQVNSLRMIRGLVRQGTSLDLLGLMKNARYSSATQPVDRMYSMLGLSADREATELVPAYDEPRLVTMKRYAGYFVQNKKATEMLHFVNHTLWEQDVPTWIPTWTSYIQNSQCLWESITHCPHHASCRLPLDTRLIEDPKFDAFWLGAKGILVSAISVIGEDHRWRNGFAAPKDGLSPTIRENFRQQIIEPYALQRDNTRSTKIYANPDDFQSACEEILRGGRPIPESTQGDWNFARCCTIIVRGYDPVDLELEEWETYWKAAALCLTNIMNNNNWSVIAVLADGRLARVPHGAQKEDCVVLFTGGQLPFLLRPVKQPEGGYQVVGPCYVYGIMDGELDHRHIEENLVEFILI